MALKKAKRGRRAQSYQSDDMLREAMRCKVREMPELQVEYIYPARTARNYQPVQDPPKESSMNAGYVFILFVVCICSGFLCLHYLRTREEYIRQQETIQRMESELHRLQSENEARESEVSRAIDMQEVKDIAINKLGLHYASEDQIRFYNIDDYGYVRQYQSVDED